MIVLVYFIVLTRKIGLGSIVGSENLNFKGSMLLRGIRRRFRRKDIKYQRCLLI